MPLFQLPHVGNRAADVKKFVKLQLQKLQMDFVDLYLIHVPFGFHCNQETLNPLIKPSGEYDLDMETDHLSIWKVRISKNKAGLVGNITKNIIFPTNPAKSSQIIN